MQVQSLVMPPFPGGREEGEEDIKWLKSHLYYHPHLWRSAELTPKPSPVEGEEILGVRTWYIVTHVRGCTGGFRMDAS